MTILILDLPDAAATENAGRNLAPGLVSGVLVTLSGGLGAGKTTFARGVLRGLGWEGPVKSPTYTLVEHYLLSSLYLYHFDFYRFEQASEWDDAGVADAFDQRSVCLVEWPERVQGLLPVADLAIELVPVAGGDARRLVATAHGSTGEQCLNALRHAGS